MVKQQVIFARESAHRYFAGISLARCHWKQIQFSNTMLVSLLPKFDELCTICATCKSDVICLVESWVVRDISDNEIS